MVLSTESLPATEARHSLDPLPAKSILRVSRAPEHLRADPPPSPQQNSTFRCLKIGVDKVLLLPCRKPGNSEPETHNEKGRPNAENTDIA